ncbi:rhodanese-like domain-containing protein [Denitromonas ohlonensis]|nr:rhodanese-like domain-containing protein [Denitromonas ohlonensis]
MPRHFPTAVGIVLTLGLAAQCLAADAPTDPKQQTSWGLYVDSREAYEMKTGPGGDAVLLVDVRDPVEIMFTGFTDVVDVNIPFMTADRSRWNDKKNVFLMQRNEDFAPAVARALAARKLGKDTAIVLMCRSGGTRGAPSAKALEGQGYERVYVVVDGFEGRTIKDGERKHWRLVDGWKNAGLPWSYTLNKAKMAAQDGAPR